VSATDDVPGVDYADKAQLVGVGRRLDERDVKVTVAGQLMLVRVRALSRAEALDLQKMEGAGLPMIERRMLSLAMVRPRMTEGDVREWQEAAPAGELEPITDACQELSGVGDGSAKDIYRRFEADPAEEFRALSSDQAGPDSAPDTPDG